LHAANQGFRLYRRALIMENKWRAARYGLDGKLGDFGEQVQMPGRGVSEGDPAFVYDGVGEVESRGGGRDIREMLRMGSGADRQLRVFEKTNDLKAVVDYIIEETEVGVAETATPVSEEKAG